MNGSDRSVICIRKSDIVNLCGRGYSLRLAVVPIAHGTVVSGYAGVDLAGFAALRTGELLALDISVILAYRICRRKRIVRQAVILRNLPYEIGSLPIRQLLAEEGMETVPEVYKV